MSRGHVECTRGHVGALDYGSAAVVLAHGSESRTKDALSAVRVSRHGRAHGACLPV